jgi:hypothetical protein
MVASTSAPGVAIVPGSADTPPGAQPGTAVTQAGGATQPLFTQGGTGAGLSAQPTVFSPGQGASPYFLNQVESSNQVNVSSDMATVLGIPAGTYHIGDLLNAFNHLDRAHLVTLQSMLSKGGFYSGTGGTPGTAQSMGTVDDASFSAFTDALLQASQNGQSLDTTVATGIGTGAGSQPQGSPIMGGGNTYQVDLTNPADLAYTAHTIFQAALGRNPTAAELARLTSTMQGEQSTYQTAKNTQAETASQAKYQADVSAEQAQKAPQLSLGDIPAGPFKDINQWATALLQYMNDPITTSNVATIVGLVNATGGDLASNNPLRITLEKPGSSQTGGGTTPTPQKYASAADGMQATAQTLAEYPWLLAALQQGTAQSVLGKSQVQGEISQLTGGKAKDITADVGAAQTAAEAAVKQYTPPTPTPAVTHQGMRRLGDDQGEAQPIGQPTVAATAPPAPAQASPDMLSPSELQTQQGALPAGSQYIAPTTLTQTAPPDPSALAFQQATTGANQIPYEGYQYLQAFNAIMQMVHANTTQGG